MRSALDLSGMCPFSLGAQVGAWTPGPVASGRGRLRPGLGAVESQPPAARGPGLANANPHAGGPPGGLSQCRPTVPCRPSPPRPGVSQGKGPH